MPAKKSTRWEKEGKEFLEALTGGHYENPLGKDTEKNPATPEELEKRRLLKHRQQTSGGRPRLSAPATDPLIPWNFKIKSSELEALRALATERTKTLRELLTEAIGDLLEKYKKTGN